MNVLFEDDGQLKAGTLLADHDASVQVEAVSGKRQKIKAAHVLLRFADEPRAGCGIRWWLKQPENRRPDPGATGDGRRDIGPL